MAIRLLLIEDNPLDAELEVRELRRAGLRVEHRRVESEPDCRQEIGRFRPQVIVSDFAMPNYDGMSALALARELCPDVPFIFVSGTLGEDYAIRALKNGATDYVLETLSHARRPSGRPAPIEVQRPRASNTQASGISG